MSDVAIALARIAGCCILVGMLAGLAGPVAPCVSAEPAICELDRPEDLSFVPQSSWLVASTASTREPLVFVDVRSGRRLGFDAVLERASTSGGGVAGSRAGDAPNGEPRSATEAANRCPGAPEQLEAGGHDVRRIGGALRLAVVNRSKAEARAATAASRVELYALELRARGLRLRWLDCRPVPARYALNDVALASDGTLYASHQFEPPGSAAEALALRERWLAGAPTGMALVWQRAGGWSALPATQLSFANGIAVSRDDRTLALAGTYSKAVLLVSRHDPGAAVRRVALPFTPDNLTAIGDGDFIAVGHTGVPVMGIDPCRDPRALPCGFPFAVARIARSGSIRTLFEHDGGRIPGASVAVPRGRQLYLGTAFGDRVSIVVAQR